MTAQRVKGQEVQVIITRAGALEDTLTDIQSFNVEVQTEIKSQGYLGEKTNRKDDIYNGVKFDMELNLHSQDWFRFQAAMLDRSRRLTPDVRFNISATLFFPNGETPTILIPDVHFGSAPMNISSRGDYVKVKLEGEADDFEIAFQ